MLPNTVFSRPSSSFERPVPAPGVDPGAVPLVCVEFNASWLPYVLGCLKQLLLNTTFDAPQGSPEFQLNQDRASQLLTIFQLARLCAEPIPISAGAEGNELMIRQNPTNPCLLESSIDGITWCAFADISKCVVGPAQPGEGTHQPPPGGCATYHATMNGSGKWYLPTPVNTGDTIDVSSAKGATNDGIGSVWLCPDGNQFFAGACVPYPTLVGTDPMPAVYHGKLIAQVGAIFYDVYGSTFTVPAGVSNQPVTFQMNYSPLGGASGDITFDVAVCNNAEGTWTHVFDFTLNDGGFVNNTYSGGVDNAVWVAGSGWESISCVSLLGGGGIYTLIGIHRIFSARTITSFIWEYDAVLGTVGTDVTRMDLLQGATPNIVLSIAPRGGTALVDTWAGSLPGVTNCSVDPILALASGSCDPAAHVRLYKLTVSGLGTDPF